MANPYNHIDRNSQEWIPDDALRLLNMERVVAPERTNEELAREILMTAAPMAAQSVAWLSVHAGAEAIRLKASQYIIDGVVGGGFKATGGVDDALMALVSQLSANDEERVQKLQ